MRRAGGSAASGPFKIESAVRSEAKTHGQYGLRVVLDDHLALDEGADLPRVPGRDPRDEVETQVRIGASYVRLVADHRGAAAHPPVDGSGDVDVVVHVEIGGEQVAAAVGGELEIGIEEPSLAADGSQRSHACERLLSVGVIPTARLELGLGEAGGREETEGRRRNRDESRSTKYPRSHVSLLSRAGGSAPA